MTSDMVQQVAANHTLPDPLPMPSLKDGIFFARDGITLYDAFYVHSYAVAYADMSMRALLDIKAPMATPVVCPLRQLEVPAAEPASAALDFYDAGLLNDFGGGDVHWWQDYLRYELNRAHEFYQSQVDSLLEPKS